MSFVEKVGRMRGKRVGSQGSLTSGCQLPISRASCSPTLIPSWRGRAWLRTVRGARDCTHPPPSQLGCCYADVAWVAGWQSIDTPCPSLPPAGHTLLLPPFPQNLPQPVASPLLVGRGQPLPEAEPLSSGPASGALPTADVHPQLRVW